jgi:hypothetical protein
VKTLKVLVLKAAHGGALLKSQHSETEAGESQVRGKPGLPRKTLSQRIKTNR